MTPEQLNNLLDTELKDMELSVHAMTSIEALNLGTLRDLINCDHQALTKKCGWKAMGEFDELLECLGLEWNDKKGYELYLSYARAHSKMVQEIKKELDDMIPTKIDNTNNIISK